MTTNSVKFCPQCGSARVDFSELANGMASCPGCLWHGKAEDLLVVNGAAGQGLVIDGRLEQMMGDLRLLLSGELGVPYLKFLLKWGFLAGDPARISQTLDRKKFARYVSAIARAVLIGMVEERARQATEETRPG